MRVKQKHFFLLVGLAAGRAAAQSPQDVVAAADRIFAQWNTATSPGCAVGVARNGQVVLMRGYGMANLETGTPITAETIFESGSVAKQFTAAATLLLASEGKLSLDDPVRKYVPELPEYGEPILVRHLLNHTSGLREWSNLVALAGWPRGTRVHTQADLLEVVTAQRSLNHRVGEYYSYTNSGFALLTTIIERVSGSSLARFTKERLFEPLAMTHSSWRDDFARIVPGRAQAYSRAQDGTWQLAMPFENVVGPGGMLTTVGDWLKWNAALDRRALGAIVDSLEKPSTLKNGRQIEYGMGLFVRRYRGLRELAHSGSTAGYSTYLARYPEQELSIAVLCNAAGANATAYTRQLVDALVPGLAPNTPPDTVVTDQAALQRFYGVYRSARTHEPLFVGVANAGRAGRGSAGSALRALRSGGYLLGANRVIFDEYQDGKPRGLRVIQSDGDTVQYLFVSATVWLPAKEELEGLAGRYRSDEIDATYTALVEDGRLVLRLRAGVRWELTPVYRDAFTAPGLGTVWFTRDSSGRGATIHVGAARVWDIAFTRQP
jgi:CubicO group peptidase (beta-lactamase class C family)